MTPLYCSWCFFTGPARFFWSGPGDICRCPPDGTACPELAGVVHSDRKQVIKLAFPFDHMYRPATIWGMYYLATRSLWLGDKCCCDGVGPPVAERTHSTSCGQEHQARRYTTTTTTTITTRTRQPPNRCDCCSVQYFNVRAVVPSLSTTTKPLYLLQWSQTRAHSGRRPIGIRWRSFISFSSKMCLFLLVL